MNVLTFYEIENFIFFFRFNSESPVDQAVLLSGWRLKVDNQSDHPYTSKLHIDYAQVCRSQLKGSVPLRIGCPELINSILHRKIKNFMQKKVCIFISVGFFQFCFSHKTLNIKIIIY